MNEAKSRVVQIPWRNKPYIKVSIFSFPKARDREESIGYDLPESLGYRGEKLKALLSTSLTVHCERVKVLI